MKDNNTIHYFLPCFFTFHRLCGTHDFKHHDQTYHINLEQEIHIKLSVRYTNRNHLTIDVYGETDKDLN